MPQKGALIQPVILCGGRGTRLWPLSRAAWPKQFLRLTGPHSLFQQTLARISDPARYAPPIFMTNDAYRFVVLEQAQEIGVTPAAVLLEPAARNTAAAIAAAAHYAVGQEGGGNRLLLVLPSDHELSDDSTYQSCVRAAAGVAEKDYLVTFGIAPTGPETGFGYIEAGAEIGPGARKVACFVEKPPLTEAEAMLAKGGFYWNSGMFLFRTGAFLAECETHARGVFHATKAAVEHAVTDLDFLRLDEGAFAQSPNISVDYAIFEHTEKAAVVPAAIAWSDLGSWDAVWKSSERDADGNAVRGPATVVDTHASLVVSEGAHVVVHGLEDVAVVASPDAVFVGRLSAAQNVGNLVKQLKADTDTEALTETHQTSYRPWGGYTSVVQGERFQVKRLFVTPGKSLSLQKHRHRAEHWIVVCGTAEVTIDGKQQIITENQSVYIPLGAEHRLANPGKILLELIEVQTGSYLGEDDIVRIEDEFGRI